MVHEIHWQQELRPKHPSIANFQPTQNRVECGGKSECTLVVVVKNLVFFKILTKLSSKSYFS